MLRAPNHEGHAIWIGPSAQPEVDIPAGFLSDYGQGLYISKIGSRMWLFGDNGLAEWTAPRGPWRSVTNVPGRAIVNVLERGDELWVACSGRTGGRDGLACLRSNRWEVYPSDAVFSMTRAWDGTLLAGGRGRVIRVDPGQGVVPRVMGVPESLQVMGVLRDGLGHYWLGNVEVGFRFAPDGVPPRTQILSANTNLIHGQALEVRLGAVERSWPVGFRNDYSFAWRLDGGPWSVDRQETVVRCPATMLRTGDHLLEVRARDAGGDVDPTPAHFQFRVHARPIQEQFWFRASIAGVLALVLALSAHAVIARSRLAGYARTLEMKVADRTSGLEAELAERRRAEEALRDSEARYRGLVEANPEAVFISQQGRIAYINKAALALFGAERPEEVLGKDPLQFFHPRYHAIIRERIADLQRVPGEAPLIEEQVVRLDGSVRDVEVTAVSYIDRGSPVLQVILRDVTDRKQAEAVRHGLLKELLQAEDEERRRIARELHDSTTQHLAAARLNVCHLRAREPALPAEAGSLVADTQDLLDQSLQELRTCSWSLHPPILEELGLAEALRDYAAGFTRRSALRVQVDAGKYRVRLSYEMELALFRVAQECLTNVHRHSASAAALIRLESDDAEVRLEVQDSGHGLPPEALRAGAGVGLRGMRERLRHLGGLLEIESDNQGTTVLASLPLEPKSVA